MKPVAERPSQFLVWSFLVLICNGPQSLMNEKTPSMRLLVACAMDF